MFGNCALDHVIVNVAITRAACGHSAISGPPLFKGESGPMVDSSRLDAGYFHGGDGLGNNSFPDEPTGIQEGEGAVDALLRVCTEASELGVPVTLLTLGPLTNLAKAIQKDRNILKKLDRFVMIGGCGNARGNVNRTSEFNVMADPEAADFVLSALVQQEVVCTLVSWELTVAYSIPWSVYDKVMSNEYAQRSRMNNFMKEICHFSFGSPHLRVSVKHRSHPDEHFGGAVICDVLAMAVALNPDIVVDSEQVNVEVELEGRITRGQTVVDWGCYDGIERKKNCDWVSRINHEAYMEMFESMFD